MFRSPGRSVPRPNIKLTVGQASSPSILTSSGVNHVADDFFTHAAFFQVDDLSGREVIHHTGIANLADDDLVADARFDQRFHINHTQ